MEIKTDTFVAVFGRKGSGKSWRSRMYQQQVLQAGIKTVTLTPLKSLKDIWNPKTTIYLDSETLSVKDHASLILDKIMKIGNYQVFIDEAHLIFAPYIDASNQPTDRKLSAFVRHSRHRNVGCFFITQRPAYFYPTALAQCDYIISFRQTYPNDIERLAEVCSPDFAEATTKLDFESREYAVFDAKTATFQIFKSQKI